MKHLIDKSALVAEIERRYKTNLIGAHSAFRNGKIEALREVKDFLNTLEVIEVHECNNVNLNPLFEEMGVEPDSRIALMFKNAFCKSVDNYLDRKENSYDRQRENP